MKRLLMTLVVLSILLSSVVKPVFADYPMPYYIDTASQYPVAGVEHFVFWKTYLYAMFTDDPYLSKPVKWWTTSNTILTHAINANSQWNALRPTGVEATVQASSAGATDLTFKYQACPTGDPSTTYGCSVVDSWSLLSTLNVNTWYKSSVYVRPDSYVVPGSSPQITQYYGAGSLQAVVSHELGHSITGLADQEFVSIMGRWCNASIATIMDGFWKDSADVIPPIKHYIYPCDVYAPIDNGHDENAWVRYHTAGRYTYYTDLVYPTTGRAVASWYDYAWNDWKMKAVWDHGNTSSGPWSNFATTYHTLDNGSHFTVPGAESRRILAEVYPIYYGIHDEWLRVCVRPIFNYVDPNGIGDERCTVFNFPY